MLVCTIAYSYEENLPHNIIIKNVKNSFKECLTKTDLDYSLLELLKHRLNHLVHILVDLLEVGVQDALQGIDG